MGLVGEIMSLVRNSEEAYADRCMSASMVNRVALLNARNAIKDRLTALESELNDLRKLYNRDFRIDPRVLRKFGLRDFVADGPVPTGEAHVWQGGKLVGKIVNLDVTPPRVESDTQRVTGITPVNAQDMLHKERLDSLTAHSQAIGEYAGLPCSNVPDWDNEDDGC